MSLVKRLFVVAACRTYRRGEETGGQLPVLVLGWFLGLSAGGFAAGWLWEELSPTQDGMAPLTGLVAGCLAITAWFVYVLAVIAVLRIRMRPIEDFLGEEWMARERRWWDR